MLTVLMDDGIVKEISHVDAKIDSSSQNLTLIFLSR